MRYCLLDVLRHRGGVSPRQAHQKTNAAGKEGEQVVDRIENPQPQDEEKWLLILEAMEQLDEKNREVFYLRYVVGLPREEVADQLGVSTKYVTRHARQAMEQVGNIVAANG